MSSLLSGKRVLVTRAREQAATFSRLIEERGGLSVEIPLIAFEPRTEVLKNIEIEEFGWVVFTSSNGVRFFFEETSLPSSIKVAAVGSKTARELKHHNVTIDLLPDDYTAEGLASALSENVDRGQSLLLPRGNLSRKILPEKLTEMGFTVRDLTIYDTIIPYDSGRALRELVNKKDIDVITFTSSSTVHHFVELLKVEDLKTTLNGVTIGVIGPITEKTLLSYGLKPDVVPEKYTIEGLLKSLEHYFENREDTNAN